MDTDRALSGRLHNRVLGRLGVVATIIALFMAVPAACDLSPTNPGIVQPDSIADDGGGQGDTN